MQIPMVRCIMPLLIMLFNLLLGIHSHNFVSIKRIQFRYSIKLKWNMLLPFGRDRKHLCTVQVYSNTLHNKALENLSTKQLIIAHCSTLFWTSIFTWKFYFFIPNVFSSSYTIQSAVWYSNDNMLCKCTSLNT